MVLVLCRFHVLQCWQRYTGSLGVIIPYKLSDLCHFFGGVIFFLQSFNKIRAPMSLGVCRCILVISYTLFFTMNRDSNMNVEWSNWVTGSLQSMEGQFSLFSTSLFSTTESFRLVLPGLSHCLLKAQSAEWGKGIRLGECIPRNMATCSTNQAQPAYDGAIFSGKEPSTLCCFLCIF